MKLLQPSICTVVIANTLPEFLTALDTIQQQADWIELRVDFIKNLTLNDVETIRQHTHKKAIFCCRATHEGGQFLGSSATQQGILQKANDLGFDYIDIDLSIADHLKIKHKKAKQIISYHNYQNTPGLAELKKYYKAMRYYQPDVFKFAVTINLPEDSDRLIHFLLEKEKQDHLIVLGMGEAGKKLRILAPLLGGYLTFAAINGSSSAPGQIELKELRDLYQRLEVLIS